MGHHSKVTCPPALPDPAPSGAAFSLPLSQLQGREPCCPLSPPRSGPACPPVGQIEGPTPGWGASFGLPICKLDPRL